MKRDPQGVPARWRSWGVGRPGRHHQPIELHPDAKLMYGCGHFRDTHYCLDCGKKTAVWVEGDGWIAGSHDCDPSDLWDVAVERGVVRKDGKRRPEPSYRPPLGHPIP